MVNVGIYTIHGAYGFMDSLDLLLCGESEIILHCQGTVDSVQITSSDVSMIQDFSGANSQIPYAPCMEYLPACGLKCMVNVGKDTIHGSYGLYLEVRVLDWLFTEVWNE